MAQQNKYTKEFLEPIVKDSYSTWEVMRNIYGNKYTTSHAHWKNIRDNIDSLGLDTSHFKIAGNRDRYLPRRKLTDELLFSRHVIRDGQNRSRYNFEAKKRLIASGLPYECAKCKVITWNGEPLSLQLEHKDGDNNNYEKDNLELLCPNCHSQTKTYAGRNKGKEQSINEQ